VEAVTLNTSSKNSGRKPNFKEQGRKLLLAEFRKKFPEVKNKGYCNNAQGKKAETWGNNAKKFIS